MPLQEKILVSACFLGERVRYNAEILSLAHPLLSQWQQEKRLISVCPEVFGGLPTPRDPAERQTDSGKIITINGTDVSQQFAKGAQQALALCKKYHIHFALLKESSPSCGSAQIYNGSFSDTKIAGQGVTSALLRQHGILVFSEHTIELLQEKLLKKSD